MMPFEPEVILGNQSSTIQDRCFCVILSVGEPANVLGVEAAAEGVPGPMRFLQAFQVLHRQGEAFEHSGRQESLSTLPVTQACVRHGSEVCRG